MDVTNAGHDLRGSNALKRQGWPLIHVLVWAIAVSLFALLPGSLEGKSLAVLHGLCAQQPDHSYFFGDARLPFDARMTGIYGGFLTTVVLLLVRGRWRAAGSPPLRIGITLVAFVGVMGIDGVNSTLRDFGLWFAYEPHNTLRLATGLMTGAALGVFVWLICMQTGFDSRARSRRPSIESFRELGVLALALSAYGGAVHSGWAPLRIPLTVLLMAAAVLVLSGLTLAFVLLLTRKDSRAVSTADLAMPATVSLIIALGLIGAMSVARFALEAWLGVPGAGGGG
jgi:uncharacterized membrane protein